MRATALIAFACFVPSLVSCLSAITTFNQYTSQSGVACGSKYRTAETQAGGAYSAAINDHSALWKGSVCSGSQDKSKCTGTGSCKDCTGPACNNMQSCGVCYNVKCTGSLEGGSGACSGKTVKVMIVDACPATHPANYCKTPAFGGTVPANNACLGSNTQFDISTAARSTLSSYGGNLNIDVQGPVAC